VELTAALAHYDLQREQHPAELAQLDTQAPPPRAAAPRPRPGLGRPPGQRVAHRPVARRGSRRTRRAHPTPSQPAQLAGPPHPHPRPHHPPPVPPARAVPAGSGTRTQPRPLTPIRAALQAAQWQQGSSPFTPSQDQENPPLRSVDQAAEGLGGSAGGRRARRKLAVRGPCAAKSGAQSCWDRSRGGRCRRECVASRPGWGPP